MASTQSTADYILEQMAGAGIITAKKMFGEYGVYCDGKIVAFIADDQLFVKLTAAGKAFIGDYIEGAPYPGAKLYLLISGDLWEDHEWLAQLIKITAAELPMPVPKKSIIDLLAMPEEGADIEFEPISLKGELYKPADLS